MRTDIAFDKLVKIIPIIAELRPKLKGDEKLKAFFDSYRKKQGDDGEENVPDNLDFVMSMIPFLFGDYKEYVFEILAIVGDKTAEEVKAQPFTETLAQIKEIIANKDLVNFFS